MIMRIEALGAQIPVDVDSEPTWQGVDSECCPFAQAKDRIEDAKETAT